MQSYLHRVAGLYGTRSAAHAALGRHVQRGLPRRKLVVLVPGSAAGYRGSTADNDDVLEEVLRQGAIGTLVGLLAGGAGTALLTAGGTALFVFNPVVGTLTLLGWGASLGAIVGASSGALGSRGSVADEVRDALALGRVVLLVHALTEEQTTAARQVIGESMGDVGNVPPGA